MLKIGASIKSGIAASLLISFFSFFSLPVQANDAQSDTRVLMQIAEYINVDYVEAIADGEVINEAEYSEMLEFSALAVEKSQALEGGEQALIVAKQLQQAVQNKANPAEIQPITVELRNLLMALSPAVTLPNELLAHEQVNVLYANNCASCHGATGGGDGPLAESLDPPPVDFTDPARAKNRSLVGLYDAVTNGIEGTGMAAYSNLDEQQRWSLAFYVGSLAFANQGLAQAVPAGMTTQDFINNSPETLIAKYPATDMAQIEQLRADPTPLFVSDDPLNIAKQQLNASLQSYKAGEYKQAQSLSVSAYLDGFELAENALSAYDSQLVRDIEKDMMNFRKLAGQADQQAALETVLASAVDKINQAQQMLSADTLSSSTLFSASLVILLREGLEALLVVLALVTVLVKTERKDAVKYVHAGWIVALLAGLGTWWAAQSLIEISGASREIMEGAGALLAAIVLFYVGFWMHSKSSAENWQAYIKNNIQRHLSRGTLWGLAGLSFIAVYREVFETVLFYQALLTQSADSESISIASGFVVGVLVLAIVAWAMIKFSMRLPITKFFAFSTYLMLILAFILTGKAVAALQEAAFISINALPVDFRASWLGIHPTWEGILAQLLVLLLSALLVFNVGPFGTKQTA